MRIKDMITQGESSPQYFDKKSMGTRLENLFFDTIKITRVVNLPLEIWNASCGKLHTWSLKEIVTWLVCLHVILNMHSLKARSLSWNPHSNYLDEKILSSEIRKVSWFSPRVNCNFSKALKSSFSRICISIIECQQFRRNLLKESHSIWTEVNTFRREGTVPDRSNLTGNVLPERLGNAKRNGKGNA